jgi:murE/murF fusion protein
MVADSHLAYARIAANLNDNPAQGLILVGVTGTNGKTTVSYLVESVLRQKGLAVGVIGTVNYRWRDAHGRDVEMPAPFTTPEPLLLQALLRQMADAGVTHVIMEVSSHALAQRRLGDLRFDVAAFTNLSRDHLDYHCDMEAYFAAKSLLFADHLKKGGATVITRLPEDDPQERIRAGRMAALADGQGARVVQCGRVGESDIYPMTIQAGLDATAISLRTPSGVVVFTTPLVGDFNVANLQTAVGICLALGLEEQALASMLSHAAGAPGRLQRVLPVAGELHFRPAVFVDYAHSPDALDKVLITLSRLSHRKMICVFGCGGDRDQGKRAIMGEIAGRNCDVVLITDDNPRTESPAAIVAQIVSGIRASGLPERTPSWLMLSKVEDKGFIVLHDRAAAISAAIDAATGEDIVLVAGKGHERYQQAVAGRRFFDDCLEAEKGLTTWRLENLILATGGELKGAPPGPTGKTTLGAVVTDSRQVTVGDIFVALSGERFDGHDFLEQVAAAGAGCCVVRRDIDRKRLPALPCLLVEDTLQALGDLAAYRRGVMKAVHRQPGLHAPDPSDGGNRVQPLVVGITGSCGKTTVKEMTAAIFEQHWPSAETDPQLPPDRVLKTRGNFNNLVGLPLSLLPLGPGHMAAVLEMGMNQPGEIDRLARIADPDIACIVNIHAAHLEGLHSLEGVARAKEELFAASRPDTVLVVNLDDPLVRAGAEKYGRKKIFYAAAAAGEQVPQVWASAMEKGETGVQGFVLHVGEETSPVTLHAPGAHNISNAVAAAAIGHAAGIGIQKIAAGLGAFRPADKRMQIVKGIGGLNIINDTYNANPASMRAGLATLGQQEGRRRMAILGDMLELGPTSAEAHRETGKYAAELALDYLALVGNFAADTAAGAEMAGLPPERVRIFTEKKEVAPWVEELLAAGRLQADDWLLVKGSRGMRLEVVVEQLVKSTD